METRKTKQINCRIIWWETVRKLIDRLERLGALEILLVEKNLGPIRFFSLPNTKQ